MHEYFMYKFIALLNSIILVKITKIKPEIKS
jgi:hypothetical protein